MCWNLSCTSVVTSLSTLMRLVSSFFSPPESLKMNPKMKKSSSTKAKKIVQPIPLDITGRPVFPIVLGGLTVHSLGEVR